MASVNTGLGGPTGHGENSFLSTSLTSGNYDDGSVSVDITSVFGASGINFFGTSYTEIYINSNGLVTFEGSNTTYNGTDLSSLNQPALAPFWTDHDLRGGDPSGSNNIYWDLDPVNGNVTITWFEAEPYQGSGANTFQMVLSDEGGGTFGVEYIYEEIGFTNGFGAQAQVGVTDGGSNDFIVPGSGDATALSTFDEDTLDPDSPDGTWDLYVNDSTVVCFLEGTLIETDKGPKPVQWLRAREMIATADHGFRPLTAVLNSQFVACAHTLPIRIAAHAFDNAADLYVSPDHRVLIADPACDLLFGSFEVFVPAKYLVGLPGVSQEATPRKVSYFHLVMEEHEVIYANGQATESFFAGDMALITLRETHQKLEEAVLQGADATETARLTLKSYEAEVLVKALMPKTKEHKRTA